MSKKLQAENKIKFGYVGGMSMNNSWFTFFWSMWGNNCDVLMPFYERDDKKLAANGWKAGTDQPCNRETVEFWAPWPCPPPSTRRSRRRSSGCSGCNGTDEPRSNRSINCPT